MILDQSVFFGVADIHDRHRDMRLDVDNMSYEVKYMKNVFAFCSPVWDCYLNTMFIGLLGAIGSGRAHRRCVHWIERRKYIEAAETAKILVSGQRSWGRSGTLLYLSGNIFFLHLHQTMSCVYALYEPLVYYFQEEYGDGEDIGTLECGHDFHYGCIKQWLMHKNLCPICKTTALGIWEGLFWGYYLKKDCTRVGPRVVKPTPGGCCFVSPLGASFSWHQSLLCHAKTQMYFFSSLYFN